MLYKPDACLHKGVEHDRYLIFYSYRVYGIECMDNWTLFYRTIKEQLYHARGFEEEYSAPPRMAAPETFEMDFGNRWKALEELERSQKEQVIQESRDRKNRLEQEMVVAMGEEQERLIRLEMERQQNELKVYLGFKIYCSHSLNWPITKRFGILLLYLISLLANADDFYPLDQGLGILFEFIFLNLNLNK